MRAKGASDPESRVLQRTRALTAIRAQAPRCGSTRHVSPPSVVKLIQASAEPADRADARRAASRGRRPARDRKSTRLNSSHANISYAVFCLKKQKKKKNNFIFNKNKKKDNKQQS